MRSKGVNFWNALAWAVPVLVACGVVWAGVSGPATLDSNTGTITPKQLANGTPGAGKYPRGGACPTGTSIDTSVGTTDRQCWSTIPASDVVGAVAKNGVNCMNASTVIAYDGQITACSNGVPVFDERYVNELPNDFPRGVDFKFKLNSTNGLSDSGTFNSVMSWRRFGSGGDWSGGPMLQLAYTDAGNLWTRINAANVWGTWKKLTVSVPSDIGAEPALPACKPGEGIIYTGTGTGTSVTKGCGIATTAVNGFDPLGTYFLHNSEGPCFEKWNTFSQGTAATSSATCSSGSDALLAEFYQCSSLDYENRILWPGGEWLAKLNAKVNANGAAIRVEVWDSAAGSGGSDAQWFNWTTGVFTNTSFATIQKQATGPERLVAARAHHVFFRLYATCSSSTQVTIQFADGSSRIESPMAKEAAPSVADVDGLTDSLAGKEPAIPAGRPGQGVGYLGTGTATGTTKGPIDLEAITTGKPGQFVKFLGTGTATTASKGGVDVTIPTPVTTRSFTVPASALNLGSGAVAGNLTSNVAIWTLRNAQSDFAYGAVITIPNDYVSGLSVSPMWYPIGADSTQSHTVKWSIGHMSMDDGAAYTLTYTSWTGKACGIACPATYVLVNETAFGFGSYAAGNVVAIGIKRLGSDAADTYTGDLALAGLKFTYTSSL